MSSANSVSSVEIGTGRAPGFHCEEASARVCNGIIGAVRSRVLNRTASGRRVITQWADRAKTSPPLLPDIERAVGVSRTVCLPRVIK